MKKPLFVITLIAVLLSACKTNTVYVPVESTKTEYKDRLLRDSVYLHDSVFIKTRGDTVFFEKHKFLYRDKLVRDSVFVTDSVQVPYPVVEYREVYKLKSWQNFLVWCGVAGLAILSVAILYFLYREK